MTFAGAIPSAKASQRHWERAAEGWDAHSLALRAWLTEATRMMFEAASISPGQTVLDIAAGGRKA